MCVYHVFHVCVKECNSDVKDCNDLAMPVLCVTLTCCFCDQHAAHFQCGCACKHVVTFVLSDHTHKSPAHHVVCNDLHTHVYAVSSLTSITLASTWLVASLSWCRGRSPCRTSSVRFTTRFRSVLLARMSFWDGKIGWKRSWTSRSLGTRFRRSGAMKMCLMCQRLKFCDLIASRPMRRTGKWWIRLKLFRTNMGGFGGVKMRRRRNISMSTPRSWRTCRSVKPGACVGTGWPGWTRGWRFQRKRRRCTQQRSSDWSRNDRTSRMPKYERTRNVLSWSGRSGQRPESVRSWKTISGMPLTTTTRIWVSSLESESTVEFVAAVWPAHPLDSTTSGVLTAEVEETLKVLHVTAGGGSTLCWEDNGLPSFFSRRCSVYRRTSTGNVVSVCSCFSNVNPRRLRLETHQYKTKHLLLRDE